MEHTTGLVYHSICGFFVQTFTCITDYYWNNLSMTNYFSSWKFSAALTWITNLFHKPNSKISKSWIQKSMPGISTCFGNVNVSIKPRWIESASPGTDALWLASNHLSGSDRQPLAAIPPFFEEIGLQVRWTSLHWNEKAIANRFSSKMCWMFRGGLYSDYAAVCPDSWGSGAVLTA